MGAAVFCGIFFYAKKQVYFQLDSFYNLIDFFAKPIFFLACQNAPAHLQASNFAFSSEAFKMLQSSADCRVCKVQFFQAKRQDFARKIYLFIKVHQLRNKPIMIIKRLLAENCWQHMISNYNQLLSTLDRGKQLDVI